MEKRKSNFVVTQAGFCRLIMYTPRSYHNQSPWGRRAYGGEYPDQEHIGEFGILLRIKKVLRKRGDYE